MSILENKSWAEIERYREKSHKSDLDRMIAERRRKQIENALKGLYGIQWISKENNYE